MPQETGSDSKHIEPPGMMSSSLVEKTRITELPRRLDSYKRVRSAALGSPFSPNMLEFWSLC